MPRSSPQPTSKAPDWPCGTHPYTRDPSPEKGSKPPLSRRAQWLKENGADVSKATLIGQGAGEAVTAIATGKVDGVFLPHTSPAIVEIEGKGNVVVPSGKMWPDRACCSLLVSGKLIREHPGLVEQIVKTQINATKYAVEHLDEVAEV